MKAAAVTSETTESGSGRNQETYVDIAAGSHESLRIFLLLHSFLDRELVLSHRSQEIIYLGFWGDFLAEKIFTRPHLLCRIFDSKHLSDEQA